MKKIVLKASILSLAAVVALSTVGCSSGGGSDDVAATTTSGVGIDGILSGSKVCIDVNANSVCDAGEDSTTTNGDGEFTLTSTQKGTLLLVGGNDIGTGLPFTGSLKAPAGSTVITPLTSALQAMVENGSSAADAETSLKKALGIDPDVVLTTFDPLKEISGTNADKAKDVLVAQAQLQTIVHAAAATVAGADGEAGENDIAGAMDNVFKEIAKNFVGATTEVTLTQAQVSTATKAAATTVYATDPAALVAVKATADASALNAVATAKTTADTIEAGTPAEATANFNAAIFQANTTLQDAVQGAATAAEVKAAALTPEQLKAISDAQAAQEAEEAKIAAATKAAQDAAAALAAAEAQKNVDKAAFEAYLAAVVASEKAAAAETAAKAAALEAAAAAAQAEASLAADEAAAKAAADAELKAAQDAAAAEAAAAVLRIAAAEKAATDAAAAADLAAAQAAAEKAAADAAAAIAAAEKTAADLAAAEAARIAAQVAAAEKAAQDAATAQAIAARIAALKAAAATALTAIEKSKTDAVASATKARTDATTAATVALSNTGAQSYATAAATAAAAAESAAATATQLATDAATHKLATDAATVEATAIEQSGLVTIKVTPAATAAATAASEAGKAATALAGAQALIANYVVEGPSAKVSSAISSLNAFNPETDSMTELLRTIKNSLGTENKDEKVLAAMIEIVEIVNSSEMQVFIDQSSGLPNLDALTGNSDALLSIASGVSTLDGTEIMHDAAVRLKNASDVIEAAFSNHTKVIAYEDARITYDDSLAIRATALGMAGALDTFASYTYGDIDKLRNSTATIGGEEYDYIPFMVDPLALFQQATFFKMSNTSRLAQAGVYVKTAAELIASIDIANISLEEITEATVADATALSAAFNGNGVYVTIEYKEESINVNKLFSSSDYIDREDFIIPSTYMGVSANVIAEYEKLQADQDAWTAYYVAQCQNYDANRTRPASNIDYNLAYSDVRKTSISLDMDASRKANNPMQRENTMQYSWVNSDCSVETYYDGWDSRFEAEFEPTPKSSFEDVFVFSKYYDFTAAEVSGKTLYLAGISYISTTNSYTEVAFIKDSTFNANTTATIVDGNTTINASYEVVNGDLHIYDNSGLNITHSKERDTYLYYNLPEECYGALYATVISNQDKYIAESLVFDNKVQRDSCAEAYASSLSSSATAVETVTVD
jgi:hypothetical protein